MIDDVSRWFEANIDSIARDIQELVAIRSISDDRDASRRALEFALDTARSFGLSTRLEAAGNVGVAELRCGERAASGREPETLGILAHVDVVDPGDPASWAHDPWGEIADGAVWGRGCVDDKGPLILCLWAIRALRELGRPLRKNILVIIGTMEEIDWEDMRAFKAAGSRLPDYGFTPDGAFPVTNREKGYCDITLSFPIAAHSGLGPWRIVSLEGGEAINAVPEKAVALLEEASPGLGFGALFAALESLPASEKRNIAIERIGTSGASVRARGVATHSCFPEKGDNAIVRLAAFLGRLGTNNVVDFIASHLGGDYLARGLGLQTRPEIVDGEYFGPTTESPDLLSTATDRFELSLNLRLAFGQTEEEAVSVFAKAGERYGFAARAEDGFLPALFVPKDRPYMKALMSAYERRTGRAGEFALDPGTSYAKAMPRIAAFGPAFPGTPDLCHEVDERLSLKDAALLGQVYADAIGSIACSSEDLA